MMNKRSGKFYFRNEKETLSKLGLKPAPGSGSGWIVKEDGENDIAMVQLKSTDSSSYRLDMLDMKKLEERREKKQAEVDRCADLRGMLYEDMKDGIISKEDYKELHAAYEQRKKNAEIAIHQIELEMDDVLNRKSKGFVWLDYFTEHKNIEKLTREVVVSLIREIKVFDKNHIDVVFDFDDCYKECLDVIESQGHFVEVDSTGKLNIRLKEAV